MPCGLFHNPNHNFYFIGNDQQYILQLDNPCYGHLSSYDPCQCCPALGKFSQASPILLNLLIMASTYVLHSHYRDQVSSYFWGRMNGVRMEQSRAEMQSESIKYLS